MSEGRGKWSGKLKLGAYMCAGLAPLPTVGMAEEVAPSLPEVKVESSAVPVEYAPGISSIGGKAPQAIRDIPQTLTVISHGVIESQSATSLKEALRYVPGITISAGEGGQIGDNINLRGQSARTDLYLDGMRDRGQYSRDAFFLDAVEVLKGPASMLFGRGSTGGVINQVSKRASLDDSGELGLRLTSEGAVRATAEVNRKLDDESAIRVSAMGQEFQGTRDVVKNEDYGVDASLRTGIGKETEYELSVLVQHNRDLPDYGVPVLWGKPVSGKSEKFYGLTDDHYDQDVASAGLLVKHQLSDGLELQNRTRLSRYELAASPTPLTTSSAPATPVSLDALNLAYSRKDRDVTDQSLFNQTDLVSRFDTGSLKHVLTTGVEIGRDDYDRQTYNWTGLGTVNIGKPIYIATPASGVRTAGDRIESVADTVAFYANDQIALTDRWQVVAGLRRDRYAIKQTTVTNAGVSTTLQHTDTNWSTRAGLIYQPDSRQSYYLSHGNSFNPSGEAVTLTTAQADVEPEKTVSWEAGAKFDLYDSALQLNGAVFRIDKRNARTTDPLTALVTLDGHTRVDGAELGAVGKVTDNIQLLAAYAYMKGKVLSSSDRTGSGTLASPYYYAEGKTLGNTPRHTATLWGTWRPVSSWELGGGAVHASERYLNNYETAKTEGYTRLDATVAYLQKKWETRLNVLNLNDVEYFETASAGRAIPSEGRTYVLSLNYRF